jgi:serine/threonine-protein kinase
VAQAIVSYREALRVKPNYFEARIGLGVALQDQGRLDEATFVYREVIRLKPDDFSAHHNLGVVLKILAKWDEAIAEYHTSIRLKPNFPQAHANLGTALRSRGEFAEAIAELRKARDLARPYPQLIPQIERELVVTERQASLAARLPAVLAGKAKPVDATETLGFAQLCYEKKLHGAAARLWAEVFQAQPKLADDMQAQHRYNAACAAALAGCGQGKDEPPPDEATKARWRKQAPEWLRADLAAWSKLLASSPPETRQSIPQTLQHWKADPDLAGLRDEAALARLPADEQNALRALWAEVDALLAKARGGTAR